MDSESRSKVVVVPCRSYDRDEVRQAVRTGVDMLGGMQRFARPGEKILVKPNFLWASDPDSAIITHPSVISAVLELVSEAGCAEIKCGDSPSHGASVKAAEKAGLGPEDLFGAELADMSREVKTPFPEGLTAKEFYFVSEALWADGIINVCKMKTHALERITGAVKNVYGLICGYRKAAGHVEYPNDGIFARMLCDIHRCLKPRLHIMDGVVAMEGNGPSAGKPARMNVLLFSEDPVALDTVFCRLINIDPQLIPTNVQGQNMGVGICDPSRIDVEVAGGEALESFVNRNFDVSKNRSLISVLGRFSTLSKRLSSRPYIKKDLCVRCGMCAKHCPVPGSAVNFRDEGKPPVYDYMKCIRCYCCQEICPQKAIAVKGFR